MGFKCKVKAKTTLLDFGKLTAVICQVITDRSHFLLAAFFRPRPEIKARVMPLNAAQRSTVEMTYDTYGGAFVEASVCTMQLLEPVLSRLLAAITIIVSLRALT